MAATRSSPGGGTDYGLYYFWRCSPWDQPDRWPVVANVLGEPWYEYEMTATELILGQLTGSVRVRDLPGPSRWRRKRFVPYAEVSWES